MRFRYTVVSDARTVRAALRDVILGDDAHAARAATELTARQLWPIAVPLSGQWRMTPVLRERLTRSPAVAAAAQLDAESAIRLRDMTVAASAHSAFAVARAREALSLLEEAGVIAVAIKGIALIASLYGHRSLRMVGDLDILVAEGAYPAARAALEAAGYVDENLALERHLSDIALSPRLHNVARNLIRDGFEIDVHWQFGANPRPGMRSERVIGRAATATLVRQTIRVASPADAMTIAAHHALRGYFAPYETVKDAYDLASWWRLKPEAWQLDDVLDTAFEADVATALCALWLLVARRAPAHPCNAGVAALKQRLSAGTRREADDLVAFCEEQFERGSNAERTVQLFNAGALVRTLGGRGRRLLRGVPDDGLPPSGLARRPLPQRIGGALKRISRVARELMRIRSYANYRALARAQGRHH